MAVYVVSSTAARPDLSERLTHIYGTNHFRQSDHTWYVRDAGTAREISEKIGIGVDPFTHSIVVATLTGSYWGRHPQELWDWLKAALEARPNG